MTTRTEVWDAVWARIENLPSFKLKSQIIPGNFQKVNTADTPALYMQLVEATNNNRPNIPTTKTMGIDLIIYISHGNTQGRTVSPARALMPLIDEVSAVFESNHDYSIGQTCDIDCCSPTQTLGGLVQHAFITEIVTDEGVNTTHGIAVLRLDILFT